jgi:hypothetical protein
MRFPVSEAISWKCCFRGIGRFATMGQGQIMKSSGAGDNPSSVSMLHVGPSTIDVTTLGVVGQSFLFDGRHYGPALSMGDTK